MIASAKRLLKPIAAGILLSIPFWHIGFGWLLIPSVVGYLLWLDTKPTVKQIWVSGLSFFAVVVNWLYHIHATELIPNNVLAIIFLALTFAVVVGSLSVGFLTFGWLYNRLDLKLEQPRSLLLIPMVWGLCEWFRSLLFSVVSMGPGGSLGPHWNFGSLAFAASVTPLGYASRIVGQFGLSALMVLLSLGIIFLMRQQWKWGIVAVLVTIVACCAGWLLGSSSKGSTLHVGVLQLDDSSYSDYGYQRDLSSLMASHDPRKPLDLLILPEYSYIFTNKEYKTAETTSLSKVTTDKSLIITSRSDEVSQGHKNLVTFYKNNGSIAAEQEKQFLIPGGEYIPYFYEWILVLSGNTSAIRAHATKNEVAAAHSPAQPVAYESDKVGALACSGAIAPDFYRRLSQRGATILTNSAALSTMGLSSSYYAQARQMASFIAMANARPFIQSARGAQIFALDSTGRVVSESDKSGVHYLEVDSQANDSQMLYTRLGDAVFLLVSGLAAAYFIINHKRY